MPNIKSKPATKEYKENWDKIFSKKKKKGLTILPECPKPFKTKSAVKGEK